MNYKILTIIILLTFSINFTLSSQSQKIIIAMNAWEPIKTETEPYGVLAQITKEAFALEGIEVQFEVAPWKRGYDYVLTGKWHGIVGWNSTEERKSLFYVSTPVLLENVVFFHHKDKEIDWESLTDLEDLSVGVIDGYNYGQELKDAFEDKLLDKEITSDEENSIKMLQAKRFDLWPSEVDVGLHQIRSYLSKEKADQLTFHPNPLQVSDLCLLLSREIPENEENIRLFEKGLKALKESGRYGEIIEELLPGSEALKTSLNYE